ncbi:unnamed protein product [Musa acuminata subsp. burmannicoides]
MANIMLLMTAITILLATRKTEGAQVPAMFVFGDSLVDPGNNNDLLTVAKANYYPNGIDFAIGTTGRYCNGGTVVDHLGNLLGLPLIPPFNSPTTTGSNILRGVNYGSAASGILWDTGLIYGDVFTLDEQIQNLKITLQQLHLLLGNGTADFLARSLFFVGMGANDYINNYLHPLPRKSRKYTPVAFTQLLIHEYRRQLEDLHDLGARKILVAGVPPLGCTPNQIGGSNDSRGECIRSSNTLAVQFNSQVKLLVHQLNTTLPGSSFLFWDTYSLIHNIIDNYLLYGDPLLLYLSTSLLLLLRPVSFACWLSDDSWVIAGFKYPNKACCGVGRSKGQVMCLPLLPLECRNRSEYIFWDPYHATDALNAIAAKDAYQGILHLTFPINVEQLVRS